MQRTYNIYHSKYNKNFIDNCHNIDFYDIDNIINYSVDFIRSDSFEYLDISSVKTTIDTLVHKLRVGGVMMISFSDMKNLCKSYCHNGMSDNDLLLSIQNKHSILSVDFLQDLIKTAYKDVGISKIEFDHKNNKTYVSIERKSI